MHISRPWPKYVQNLKKIDIKLYEELRSQCTHCHNCKEFRITTRKRARYAPESLCVVHVNKDSDSLKQ